MKEENIRLFKSVPRHKIHLQKKQHTINECYQPRKCKKGLYCSGDQFDYVVPWEVKTRRAETRVREEAYR